MPYPVTLKRRGVRLLWVGAWAVLLCACSPTYNWREVGMDGTSLMAMLPCKPDRAMRDLPLLMSRAIAVNMAGCKAGAATFAVAWADVGSAGEAVGAMARWKQGTLQPFQGGTIHPLPYPGRDLAQGHEVQAVLATVRQVDGEPLAMRGVWFIRGTQVFQALVLGSDLPDDVTEPFLSGLKLK